MAAQRLVISQQVRQESSYDEKRKTEIQYFYCETGFEELL
jgi:hypothetical protein